MEWAIEVKNLSKVFQVRQIKRGIWGALKGLFCLKTTCVEAIKEIGFTIQAGERVAFIGPNGAGKSTTIKMLTGILHPSSGSATVLGLTPWEHRKKLGFQIGTVFGQRTQLWYHLPPSDTFELLAKIYELDESSYQARLKELADLFEIEPFLHKPVRQLSLGQRMRCEIVASLLHNPKILFLDEPTIGLDIDAKLKIRGLINHLSKKQGTTIFLTSHDTADIEQVCDRVIVLDEGKILRDCSLRELKKAYSTKKRITLITEEKILNLPGIIPLENDNYIFRCEIDTHFIEKLLHDTLKITTLKDMAIEDPTMEEIIRRLYAKVSEDL